MVEEVGLGGVPAEQAQESGGLGVFRPQSEVQQMPWDRLATYLATYGHRLSSEVAPRQFAGGLGNLNYLIEVNGQPHVLRRPPLGPIPPGANDMAREHRVLENLWREFPLAPRSLLYCEDPEVLGAHFLIMDYRPGLTIGGVLPSRFDSRKVGPQLAGTMVDLVVALHRVDPARVGLEGLGKPEGFLVRAVEGWAKRAGIACDGAPGTVTESLVGWLRAHQVPVGVPTLLHSDFKLDNIVLDPVTLAPRAVLDWDMSTRGDPLFDLATWLSYWTEANDPPAMHALAQMPTAAPGFPTRNEMVAAYAKLSGRDVSDFRFHRVLTMFKLGVVFLQLHARYRSGATTDPRYAAFGTLGDGLLDFAHEVAQQRAD